MNDGIYDLRNKRLSKAPPRFELGISCLLDRRFNQLSHGAEVLSSQSQYKIRYSKHLQQEKKCCSPNVGLEPTTLRLRVSCSTD